MTVDPIRKFKLLLEESVGIPFTGGNRIKVYKNGQEIYSAMLKAIENSKRSIEFLTYVYWSGEMGEKFASALAKKASEGVEVHVLVDAIGGKRLSRKHMHKMKSHGVKFEKFRPVFSKYITAINHRTHRKVLVCDRKIGFTGGVGIADVWKGKGRKKKEWRETQFSIEGPAVQGLRAGFIGNWIETENGIKNFLKDIHPMKQNGTSEIQLVRTSSSVKWNDIATVLETLLAHAQKEVNITTPYFIIDHKMMRSLCKAASRKVKVRVLIPLKHTDYRMIAFVSKTQFKKLLECGVQIYEYLPTFIHAKIITVDNVLSCIGSANFNNRSLKLDEELFLSVLDKGLAKTLNKHFKEDLKQSKPYTLKELNERSWAEKTLGQVASVLKSHM